MVELREKHPGGLLGTCWIHSQNREDDKNQKPWGRNLENASALELRHLVGTCHRQLGPWIGMTKEGSGLEKEMESLLESECLCPEGDH